MLAEIGNPFSCPSKPRHGVAGPGKTTHPFRLKYRALLLILSLSHLTLTFFLQRSRRSSSRLHPSSSTITRFATLLTRLGFVTTLNRLPYRELLRHP